MPKENNNLYVILGALSMKPRSGYDIKKDIEASTGYFWKVNYAQIYPTLKKLDDEGYVTFVTEKNEGRPDRKVYKITQKGLDELQKWLASPVNYKNSQGNELMVKLYFGRSIPIEENIRRLNEFKEQCELKLEKLREIKNHLESKTVRDLSVECALITVRQGQIIAQAKIDWCVESINRLNLFKDNK